MTDASKETHADTDSGPGPGAILYELVNSVFDEPQESDSSDACSELLTVSPHTARKSNSRPRIMTKKSHLDDDEYESGRGDG